MKKALLIAFCVASIMGLSACMGTRGYNGNQRVCENDYFLGVISFSELFSPCNNRTAR